MFEPASQCMGEEIGYKLTIIYNKEMNMYFLQGFTARNNINNPNKIEYDADGAALKFDSMEKLLNHIQEYK